MGTVDSKEPAPFDANDLCTWQIAHAERVLEAHAAMNYDFGLDKHHLIMLLTDAIPDVSILADQVWSAFAQRPQISRSGATSGHLSAEHSRAAAQQLTRHTGRS